MEFMAAASIAIIFILLVYSFLTHLCFCDNPACINIGRRLRLEQEWNTAIPGMGRKPIDSIERAIVTQDDDAIACMETMLRYFPESCPSSFECMHSHWFCTRLKEHKGDHVAASDHPYRPILARWNKGFSLRPFDQRQILP